MGKIVRGLPWLALLLLSSPVCAAPDVLADSSSAVGKAGGVILDAIAGRTFAEAFHTTRSPSNPFAIDLNAVAAAAGAKALASDGGGVAAEGQLSILPQFNTPQAKFGASEATPAIIPFAFMVGGHCAGGYAVGFPAATKVMSSDLAGHVCSATAIDDALADQYAKQVASAKEAAAKAPVAGTSAPSATTAADAGKPAAATNTTGPALPPGATIAAPGSDVDKVGQIIVAAIGGRTVQEAIDAGGDNSNPFGLDADPLLTAAGVYFISNDESGAAIEQSEFSIYADYITPGGLFLPSDLTPAILPFAFNRGGKCFGGYVTGYPAGDKVYALDMTDRVCNSKTVDDAVNAAYHLVSAETAKPADGSSSGTNNGSTGGEPSAAKPSGNEPTGDEGGTDEEAAASGATPSATPPDNTVFDGAAATDHDLDMIVYAAYVAAYRQALKHNNFFVSADFQYADLRNSIRDALEKEGYGATTVATAPSPSATAAKSCATDGKIELRLAFNADGVGVTLAAVSDKRLSAYDYDPAKSASLAITKGEDCGAAGGAGAPDKVTAPVH